VILPPMSVTYTVPSLDRALRLWAAAAGTAGAYMPAAIEMIALRLCSSPESLSAVLTEAVDLADGWSSADGWAGPLPRRPTISGPYQGRVSSLHWYTSAEVYLREEYDSTYTVGVIDHATRAEAMITAAAMPDPVEWAQTDDGPIHVGALAHDLDTPDEPAPLWRVAAIVGERALLAREDGTHPPMWRGLAEIQYSWEW